VKRFLIILSILALTGVAQSQTRAPADQDTDERAGVDMALSIPQQVVIDSIDLRSMTLVAGGQRFSLAGDESNEMSADSLSDLRDLRAGMEVFIQTDGTEPNQDHQPVILRIWRE